MAGFTDQSILTRVAEKETGSAVGDGGNSGFKLIYELDVCCSLADKARNS